MKSRFKIQALVILIWLIQMLIVPTTAGAAPGGNGSQAHHHRGAPPPPLRCNNIKSEGTGQALILTPSLNRPLTRGEQARLYSPGLSSLGGANSERQIYDVKFAPGHSYASFKNLEQFVNKNKFPGPVTLKVTGLAGQKTTKIDPNAEVNLGGLKDEIVSKWKITDPENQSVTLYLQLELGSATVIAAINRADSATQDCLASKVPGTSSTPKGDQKEIAQAKPAATNPVFGLPITAPFIVTYFYGPRIFNSMHSSIRMEQIQAAPTSGAPPTSGSVNETRDAVTISAHPKSVSAFLNKYWNFHSGIDFSVPKNTPVHAPLDGIVYDFGPMGCAGNTLILAHAIQVPGQPEKTVFSVYEHLQNAGKVVARGNLKVIPWKPGYKLKPGEKIRRIRPGDLVSQGELIAHSGKTGDKIRFSRGYKDGCVGGPHLHFEIRAPRENSSDPNGVAIGNRFVFIETETAPVNPADFIPEVDLACQTRKTLEMNNAAALAKEHPRAIPPLTAGFCSSQYEKTLKDEPGLYQLTRKNDDEIKTEM